VILQPSLEGFGLRLEPAFEGHAEGLARHADPSLFQYSISAIPPTIDAAGLAYHLDALRDAGLLPYVMVQNDEPVGVSCFMDIRPLHRGLEIGSTWIGKRFQGTRVNPAAKFLMLRHAFEGLGYERVQLKCDARNVHSQRAIARLGAQREGVLRHHMILPDGYVRDTVMFSILAEEWPMVRDGLLERLRTA
jgi:RimJ/RimL family protein N-acetyltransferase